ncbi:Amino-acid racemase isoform 2 [Cucumis melo var. makuwa]|uniref:Amino-acid racemase isoform 2 n=1 Tax=Cucumis melo var. makuwa TaxID=1194695 RepID=A0A5D3E266_CUCMM|nr:Amino-acid racemase isoform 2 [Cucumis melo var. makuwa]
MMLHGGMAMHFYAPIFPAPVRRNANEGITRFRRRINLYSSVQISSVVQTDANDNLPRSKKISSLGKSLSKTRTPKPLLVQPNTVGVIGGVSVFSTLLFLEKLVWWSLKDGQESIPFVVCSEPALGKGIPPVTSLCTFSTDSSQYGHSDAPIIENLNRKRAFLELSGARCLITPCHLTHRWLSDTSESCKLPFLHVGDCVARELKEATLKPLEGGRNVRIGLLATDTTVTGIYYERLQNQGFDVLLPDEATMKHIVIPAVEALNKRDQEGARNLLRIAVHVLLIRAVNMVILASDELLNLLPPDDPILKKCIDPMDALARAAIKWSRSTENLQ